MPPQHRLLSHAGTKLKLIQVVALIHNPFVQDPTLRTQLGAEQGKREQANPYLGLCLAHKVQLPIAHNSEATLPTQASPTKLAGTNCIFV